MPEYTKTTGGYFYKTYKNGKSVRVSKAVYDRNKMAGGQINTIDQHLLTDYWNNKQPSNQGSLVRQPRFKGDLQNKVNPTEINPTEINPTKINPDRKKSISSWFSWGNTRKRQWLTEINNFINKVEGDFDKIGTFLRSTVKRLNDNKNIRKINMLYFIYQIWCDRYKVAMRNLLETRANILYDNEYIKQYYEYTDMSDIIGKHNIL